MLTTGGCGRDKGPPPGANTAPASQEPDVPPQFIDETFDKLHPIFLLRKVKPGPKSALWRNYYGRWVRWTGTVRSITPNGITLKQIPPTVTFDVSLWVESPQQQKLREILKVGDRVTYIGRLDSYDDVFRTMYLVHGRIIENHGTKDGGT